MDSVIFPDSKKWWVYTQYSEEDRQKIDDFLQPHSKRFEMTENFYENMSQVA